ncbi:MAG: ADP-forming succinate--CoA ligase subunit beta [Deltaproteobacteria bacterium]|nr:ADP-forming succinate--CoA ligase subunit beta [Deltaproteobacteria bacterium]
MKIHEYQGKELLRKFGVSVPEGRIAFTPDEAYSTAKELGGTVVVKAQIHAGGRGKGGGVKVCKTADEAREAAKKMLHWNLVTHQTGPEGKEVKKVLIEKGCEIAKELYLGMVLDRATARVTIMASREGGVEIEEVASKHPEKIFKMAVDPAVGFQGYQGRELGFGLGLDKELVGKFVKFVGGLYNAYVSCDCSLAEINPLVITKSSDLLALDAKINFDDNAFYRHKEFEELRDLDEEDPSEMEAKKHDLNYISLNGNIGCMVNGAGLAMATMDIIKLCGGEPANFLDVGGGATKENVAAAFKIILRDSKVKAILINIFGGIVKCDMVADGIVSAAREMHVKVPLVVRLQGTNVDAGRKILAGSGLNIIAADGFAEAAEKAVKSI